MTGFAEPAGLLLLAYAMGCINAAYYLLRVLDQLHGSVGRDIRHYGSGNAGARNAGRLLGRAAFLLVFLIDAGKGLLAVWLARQLAPAWAPACALAACAGHVWPLQLQGRGGRGVATALGSLLALAPGLLLLIGLCLLPAYAALRRFTPAGLAAFWAAGLIATRCAPPALTLTLLLLAALLSYTHRHSLHTEVTS